MPDGVKKVIFSFKNAFRGLFYVFKKEKNFQIELLCAFLVIFLMVITDLSKWEKVMLIFLIFAVLTLEILNTSVERLVNLFKPKIHPYARAIKDIMAGAVLLASVGAIIIALFIFLPYII